jgi:hypothetical protein
MFATFALMTNRKMEIRLVKMRSSHFNVHCAVLGNDHLRLVDKCCVLAINCRYWIDMQSFKFTGPYKQQVRSSDALMASKNLTYHTLFNFRHLLVALALFDSLFLIFATLDVTPTNLHIFLNSPSLNSLYTRLVLYIRTIASTFFRASIL